MRSQTTRSSARPRHVRVALFTALVLATGAACSWGDDSASGGDATQTAGPEDDDTGRGDTGDSDSGGDTGDGDRNGAVGSYVRVARATQQADGSPVPVGVVADQAADQMATDECPGGELCIEIEIQPGDPTCDFVRAEPAASEPIKVGATLTLFGDCDVRLVPDPNDPSQYIRVGTEATDEPSVPSTQPSAEPSPSTVPSPEPPAGPTPEPSDGAQG